MELVLGLPHLRHGGATAFDIQNDCQVWGTPPLPASSGSFTVCVTRPATLVSLAKPQESKNQNEVDLKGNTCRFEWVQKNLEFLSNIQN